VQSEIFSEVLSMGFLEKRNLMKYLPVNFSSVYEQNGDKINIYSLDGIDRSGIIALIQFVMTTNNAFY
jgi:hypothetical protein